MSVCVCMCLCEGEKGYRVPVCQPISVSESIFCVAGNLCFVRACPRSDIQEGYRYYITEDEAFLSIKGNLSSQTSTLNPKYLDTFLIIWTQLYIWFYSHELEVPLQRNKIIIHLFFFIFLQIY